MQLLSLLKELSLHPKNAEELKDFILWLAMQGKLTEGWRSTNVGVISGSELISINKVSREKLIKSKEIRKDKYKESIDEDEKLFDIPSTWAWSRLIDNCSHITDIDHKMPKAVEHGVKFLSAKDLLDDGTLNLGGDVKMISEEDYLHYSKRIKPRRGDIIYSRIGTLGKSRIVNTDERFLVSYSCCTIRPLKIDVNFLNYYLGSSFLLKQAMRDYRGIGVPDLGINKIKEFTVPIPPLEEQKAIVEVVNQLFAEVEQLEALTKERISLKEDFVTSALRRLTETEYTATEWKWLKDQFSNFFTEKSSVKKLREAILQLAVQGKLTAKWREENPEVEPASELLKKIEAEKKQLIKDQKIKKETPLPPVEEDEIPYDLPRGWVWCRFGDIIMFLNGFAFKSTSYVPESNYQVIRLGNVKNDNFLVNTKEAYVPESIGRETLAYQLFKDDILTTLTGTKAKRDYCFTCLIKEEHLEERILLLNQRVGCIRAIDKSSSELLNKFLKSNVILDQLFATESGTANQGNIGSTAFKEVMFPLPPSKEQEEIIIKVNSLMALCDELEQQIEISHTQVEQLMQSCLKEVFEIA